jgi:hypothetical protein
MTTHQAIAIAFPLLTAGFMGLLAYGTVRYLRHQQYKDLRHKAIEVARDAHEAAMTYRDEPMPSAAWNILRENLEEAKTAIDKAQRHLSSAK